MTEARTLRQGFLVNLRTSVGGGNVQYERRDIDPLHVTETGSQVSRWETTRHVIDADELSRAIKVRGKARGMVVNVCTATSFGLLCPFDREPDLDAAVMAARKLCWEFNTEAKHTQIQFNAITGRIEQDDVKAVQAISLELQELIGVIQAGAAELDVKKIRDAAQKMRDTGQMLSPAAKLKVDDLVADARKMARKMAKAGEQAAAEVDDVTMEKLRSARTAFLDIDADEQTDAEEAAAADVAAAQRAAGTRAVDFDAWNDDDPWGEDPDDGHAANNGDGLVPFDDDEQGAAAADSASPSQPAMDMDALDDDADSVVA